MKQKVSKTRNRTLSWIILRFKKVNRLWMLLLIGLLFIHVLIQSYLPILNKKLLDEGLLVADFDISYKIILLIFILSIIGTLLTLLKEKIRVIIYNKFKLELSQDVYKHLLNIRYEHIEYRNGTELVSTLESDIDKVSIVTDEIFVLLITQWLLFLGAIIGLIYVDIRLALAMLIYIPIKLITTQVLAKKNLLQTTSRNTVNLEHMSWLGNVIGGIKEIKIFNQQNRFLNEYKKRATSRVDLESKISWLNTIKSSFNSFLNDLTIFIIYFLGLWFLLNGSITIGGILAFVTFSQKMIAPLGFIIDSKFIFANIKPSAQRLCKFLECAEENTSNGTSIEAVTEIQFDHVSFSYDGNRDALKNVTFSINKGEKVGLVGKNGSGKSTIIDILIGTYTVQTGSILINSIDLSAIDLAQYRSRLSVVSQNIYLFNDSIRNNITLLNCRGADQLEEVILMCGLDELISNVGLDFNVGVNGVNLSGGQKQKIALARAMYHNSDVYIFDEISSNTDSETVRYIKSVIKNGLKDKIVIVSSHDETLISIMDYCLHLDEGALTADI